MRNGCVERTGYNSYKAEEGRGDDEVDRRWIRNVDLRPKQGTQSGDMKAMLLEDQGHVIDELTSASGAPDDIISWNKPSTMPSIFARKVAAFPFPGAESATTECLTT